MNVEAVANVLNPNATVKVCLTVQNTSFVGQIVGNLNLGLVLGKSNAVITNPSSTQENYKDSSGIFTAVYKARLRAGFHNSYSKIVS